MKIQNKIFAGILATSLLWVSTLSFVSAATGSSTWTTKTQVQELIAKQKAGTTLTDAEKKILESNKWNFQWKGHRGERRWEWSFGWPELQLTESEKTDLESMSDIQKQAFFEKKRTEQDAKMEAREAVIDKKLNDQSLTDAEKLILDDIKKERAAMKIFKEKRKAEMEAIKPILDKKRAGTTLTTDEQAKLDAFEASHPKMGEKWPRGHAHKWK
jgi:hypothetical protein